MAGPINSSSDEVVNGIIARVSWDVGLNRRPDDQCGGADAYSCFAEEFPGTIGYGPTAEIARGAAEDILRRQLANAVKIPQRRAALREATVQLNVRLRESVKREIERRAVEAGMSLGKYVEQCALNPEVVMGTSSSTLERTLANLDERLRRLESPRSDAAKLHS